MPRLSPSNWDVARSTVPLVLVPLGPGVVGDPVVLKAEAGHAKALAMVAAGHAAGMAQGAAAQQVLMHPRVRAHAEPASTGTPGQARGENKKPGIAGFFCEHQAI